jgi:hypothetical protein
MMQSSGLAIVGRCLLLVTALGACTEWHVEATSPSEVVKTAHPSRLRITQTDSTQTVVEAPAIVGDSLRGRVEGSPWAIALPDIAAVAVRRPGDGRSAMLVGGVLVAAGIIAFSAGSDGPSPLRN